MDMEKVIEYAIGFGDGLTDVGFEYIDEATGKKDEPILRKPSTWLHIGTGAGLIVADYMGYLRGKTSTIGAVLAGRHIGKAVGEIIKAVAEKQPVWEKKSELGESVVVYEEVSEASPTPEITVESTPEGAEVVELETSETPSTEIKGEVPGQAL